MENNKGYAVFFFPQALEALGEAIKPYLQIGAMGEHVLCREIDAGGALIEMMLDGRSEDGRRVELELMVPSGMVRMIVSAHSDGLFGFGPRRHSAEALEPALPPVGPTGSPTEAPPEALPAEAATTADASAVAPMQTPPKP